MYSDFDLRALYEALDEYRIMREMSWSAAAREINHSKAKGDSLKTARRALALSTIIGIKDKPQVEGDGVLQMLLWLGRTPESFIPGFGEADNVRFRLPEVGTGQVLRWDTNALYSALDGQRQARGMTWDAAAREVGGYSSSMLTHLAKGGRTAFPRVMRIVRWLDQPAACFTRTVVGSGDLMVWLKTNSPMAQCLLMSNVSNPDRSCPSAMPGWVSMGPGALGNSLEG